MILIPILALIVGVLIALAIGYSPSGVVAQYIALAAVAGMDSVLGGWRAGLEGKFRTGIFVTGFFSNILIAFFLAWLGDQIGINLFLAAALILVWRMFNNLSLIRRILLTNFRETRERKRRKMLQEQSASPAPTSSDG